ncbi:MAG: pectin acetylesterase-family hydrolase [Colwellia sp.]|nr:pectin acetylesterase-family hydrolase [Colwellia sp.]
MKNRYWLSILLLLCSTNLVAKTSWQEIPVNKEITIIKEDGTSSIINPACALDALADPTTGELIDNSFRFYFKQGKSKNLLVYFNGGGACWDDATCVASLALGDRPTYNPSILDENSPINAGGIFDDRNKENPFRDWSKVYIPYCSGDIHIGSSDQVYTDKTGLITGHQDAPVLIKHHGFDNFMAVREWLKTKFKAKKHKIKKLMVTGSSAGAYGASFNFPYLQSAFPKVNATLFSDAGEGVVTNGFIESAFTSNGVWQVGDTLPRIFNDALGTFYAESFNIDIITKLSEAYPESRFAQYTTKFDAVQVQFLKIMDQLDTLNDDPSTWGLTDVDYGYFYDWNMSMEASLTYLSENTDNYQYYIGAGNIHTVLTDAFATPETPHPFYAESSAQGVLFTRWLKKFSKAKKKFEEFSVKFEE